MTTLLYTCPDCHGFGEREVLNFFLDTTELRGCATCHGDGTVDTPPDDDDDDDDDDGEPADIDSDAGYDPYTGGPEDDGYDTGCDEC